MDIHEVAVIGTGAMGPGIAAQLALAGARATLVSRTAVTAMRGVFAAQAVLQQLQQHGLAAPAAVAEAMPRLFGADNPGAPVAAAEFVLETIVEDMSLKKELFARLDQIAPPGAILASCTSGLSITEIATAARHPGRVITAHFWNPPHLMPLVEVVMGAQTEEPVAMRTMDILRDLGKTPVLLRKDRPGQLGNRIQSALMREAISIVEQGIASVEDVDKAVRLGFGLRMPVWGPLQHIDAVGLDLVLAVQDYVLPDLNNEPRAPQLLRDKVTRGELGQKTGRGFYDSATHDHEAAKKARDTFLIDFLRSRQNH
ncbi:MAG TPA: 3-hydroxyacyl-CoA dehydrogenase family protein [Bryobacterales bacterium]|nr:3-hydroxyacyl-CoA dehydrogenase family protein [Bryobacterales bacterium]